MTKNIILFDVDGTIAESGQIIDPEIKELISSLKQHYDIGVVGGGKKDKILYQLQDLYITPIYKKMGHFKSPFFLIINVIAFI